MNIVIDTSVWSLFLRRKKTDESDRYVTKLRYHLEHEDCLFLIGPILLELLDGVMHREQFDLLDEYLLPFPLIDLDRSDYIEAARLKNFCRNKGVQASSVDFLIASVCIKRGFSLLTADNDFNYIAKHCKLLLLQA